MAHRSERHGEESDGDLLSRGEDGVHLPRVRGGRDGVREGDERVGRFPHRGHHHDHAVALLRGLGDAAGDAFDFLGVGDGRAAVLLDDQLTHEEVIVHDRSARCKGSRPSCR